MAKEAIPSFVSTGKEGSAVTQYADGVLTLIGTDGAYTDTTQDGAKTQFVYSLEGIPGTTFLGKEAIP